MSHNQIIVNGVRVFVQFRKNFKGLPFYNEDFQNKTTYKVLYKNFERETLLSTSDFPQNHVKFKNTKKNKSNKIAFSTTLLW